MLLLLLKGFVIGFAVAAPIGPVGLLCIRRSMADGKLAGMVTGLGAAVADALMALIAAFGVKTIIDFVQGHEIGFQIVGGLILAMMGVAAMMAKTQAKTAGPVHVSNLAGAFVSTIALTLANPVTIVSLLSIFAIFGITLQNSGIAGPSSFALSVFFGSTAWWIILSTFADWFGRKLNTHLLKSINVGTGLLLLLFGLFEFVAGIVHLS